MASIFKRGRDNGKRRAFWYVSYTDHKGIRRTKKGFTDKTLTQQLGAKLENEAMLRQRGLIDPEDERIALQKAFPISGHLDAFAKSLAPNSEKYIKLLMSRVRRLVDECEFEVAGDIEPEAVTTTLNEMREADGFGHRTYNHYIQALNTFCNWLVVSRRLAANPVVGVERLNTDVDVRHPRRALSPDEVTELVESARNSGETIADLTGEQRARVYVVSYMTGLRRKEMASLTPRSFDLDGDPPTLTVKATVSKHRKKDVLPLHPELVTMLREWTQGMRPDEQLFERLDRKKTWLMVKKDLERVGIPYENEHGIADFHAAGRHSHVTELLRSGASLPEARELARHADIRTTMKYTHIGMADRANALRNLRWQRNGSGARDLPPHESSPNDNGRPSDHHQKLDESSDQPCTSGLLSRSLSPYGKKRRRASERVRFPPPPLISLCIRDVRSNGRGSVLLVFERVEGFKNQLELLVAKGACFQMLSYAI
ncbi:MAG: tyrosine-type recombinase/integrase [Pirellulales bacterium]